MISKSNASIFFQDLIEVVKTSFEGDNKDALLALLLPKHEHEVMCLHNALKVQKNYTRTLRHFDTSNLSFQNGKARTKKVVVQLRQPVHCSTV
jgi:hypothetical protein